MSTTDDGAAEVAFDATSDREWFPINTAPKDGSEVDLRNEALNVKFSLKPWRWSHGFWVQGPHQWRPDALGPTHWRSWVENVPAVTWRPAPVEPAGDPVRDGGAWQPIETAPKDGTEVDLWIAPLSEDGFSLTPCRVPDAHYHCGEWLIWSGNPETGYIRIDHRITHWMPLPPPPGAAPQPDPDLEAAITTLLTQVGSSHEAHPGAKRDLVRAFLARHGAGARGEVGAGEDAAFVEKVAKFVRQVKVKAEGDERFGFWFGYLVGRILDFCEDASRGARAPVAGGESVAPVAWRNWTGREWTYTFWQHQGSEPLYAHPPAPPAPTAERAQPEPPHGHQAPPAAPVGGVSEACNEIAEGIKQLRRTWERVNAHEPVKALSEALCVVDIVRDRNTPTPDDGCPKGDPDCLGGNGDCHDACSTFAERGAVEAAVAVERERCVSIVEDFTTRWGEHALRHYLVCSIRDIPIFEKSK